MKKLLLVALSAVTFNATAQQVSAYIGEASKALEEKIAQVSLERLQAAKNPQSPEEMATILVEILKEFKTESLEAALKDCKAATQKEKECSCFLEKQEKVYDKNIALVEKSASLSTPEDMQKYQEEMAVLAEEAEAELKACGLEVPMNNNY